jgi:hypothetical protein
VYADVPQEISAQAEARRAQLLEQEQIKEQEELEARRALCATSTQPELDPNCS